MKCMSSYISFTNNVSTENCDTNPNISRSRSRKTTVKKNVIMLSPTAHIRRYDKENVLSFLSKGGKGNNCPSYFSVKDVCLV